MTKKARPNGKIESIFKGYVIDVRREGMDMPDGRSVDFEIVRHAPATAILAIDDLNRTILVRQFRPPLGEEIWEIPAGLVEPGEEPLVCAKRELREETGYTASEWTSLGEMLTAPGFCDEVIYLFLARGLTAGAQELDDNEVLQPHVIPIEEVHSMAHSGEITDGKSLSALYRSQKFL